LACLHPHLHQLSRLSPQTWLFKLGIGLGQELEQELVQELVPELELGLVKGLVLGLVERRFS
jgi:hypothetical protein